MFLLKQFKSKSLYVIQLADKYRRQKCLAKYVKVISFRPICTTRCSVAKLFTDRENAHSYEVFRQSKEYKLAPENNLVWLKEEISEDIINKVCENRPKISDDLVNGLKAIVSFCNKSGVEISDKRFDNFVDYFGLSCGILSDDQLKICLDVLRYIPEPPGSKSRNFFELWKPLDDTCVVRLPNYDTDEIFLLSDYWYQLRLAKLSEFVNRGVQKMGRKVRKLNPRQLVQFTFMCNLLRNPCVEMIDVEKYFDRVFSELSIHEVGIMCSGFFKTQSRLQKEELISKIYERIINNIDEINDISLVNCIKALRYSSKLAQADLMTEFLQKICPHLNRISLLACLHIALMGCDLQIYDERCIEMILIRFIKNINQARLKDLERISHVMGLFNVKTKSGVEVELCKSILSNLRFRIDEIIRYPKCFQACLHYLTLCNHYNEDLLNASLDKVLIQHIYGENNLLGREVFCLDSFARINLKNTYNGNLLNHSQRNFMGKLFTHFIPEKNSKFKLNVTDRILVEVNEECRAIFGNSYVKHVVPHFERADIVVAYDVAELKGLPLNIESHDYSGKILNLEDVLGNKSKNVKMISIVVGGWNNFVRKTNRPTGLLMMKLEQLEILGYKVILVPWYEWREQETTTDKHAYLHRKINVK